MAIIVQIIRYFAVINQKYQFTIVTIRIGLIITRVIRFQIVWVVVNQIKSLFIIIAMFQTLIFKFIVLWY